jgi:hypothetical protein
MCFLAVFAAAQAYQSVRSPSKSLPAALQYGRQSAYSSMPLSTGSRIQAPRTNPAGMCPSNVLFVTLLSLLNLENQPAGRQSYPLTPSGGTT